MSELNITSTAIEKGIDAVKGFLEKLAGGAIEEAGLLFADKIRVRRLKNQITILKKAQKIAKDTNIDIKQINLKVLVPLLENCSLEEEESLQDMWANLIVNYADPNKVYKSTVFPFILSQLTSDDVNFIESYKHRFDNLYVITHTRAEIANLIRLGIFEKNISKKMLFRYDTYTITAIGKEFFTCCANIKFEY